MKRRLSVGGYTGRLLRIDLSTGQTKDESLDEEVLRTYIGGTGLGVKILYDEVSPGVKWSDPQNRLIMTSGPVGGTIGGSGTFSVVTKGPMTNGALSAQAGGFMGAYMKFSGYDGIIIQGAASQPVYIYLHDGIAELRDAEHLTGKDTWETENLVKQELGKRETQLSVFSIGPAGEHMVRFAAIVGDRGHVVAHGGPGAVMGSKKLKAIVAEHGNRRVSVIHRETLSELRKRGLEEAKKFPPGLSIYEWGTSNYFQVMQQAGALPVKNYLETNFSETEKFMGSDYRQRFDMKRHPCWGCRFNHANLIKITNGPYAGFTGEEPEYEDFATWGPLTLQTDPAAAVVLSNEIDRYGMDTNESGWLIAWMMECYEKGLITKAHTDGIEMTWGNVTAMRQMLRKIAYREGCGDILAEGVMRAVKQIGGEAADIAIFTKKGNTPRGHDHRGMWQVILDVCLSNTGTDEASLIITTPARLNLPPTTDPFTPEGAAAMLAAGGGTMPLEDSLVICRLTLAGLPEERSVEILNAVTGWDFTPADGRKLGRRIIHLLKAFNVRHGHTPAMDEPSARYASALSEGLSAGKCFMTVFDKARREYYKLVGWDEKTGRPLPETLEMFGLNHVIKDLWE